MDSWAHAPMNPCTHGPTGPVAGAGAGAPGGATLRAGSLRFPRNLQEKQHSEKTTLWAPEKLVFGNIFETWTPKIALWAQMGPGPKRALGPMGPVPKWAQWALGPMGPGPKWAGPNEPGPGHMGLKRGVLRAHCKPTLRLSPLLVGPDTK